MTKPPDKNEGDWPEYRLLHIQTLEWLTVEVRKNHDEILTLKVKWGIIAALSGCVSGVIGAIISGVIGSYLKK